LNSRKDGHTKGNVRLCKQGHFELHTHALTTN
jgi:hypothetical protein